MKARFLRLAAWRGTDLMPVDHIRYDLLTQEALRSMVRRVLTDAARNGLPGEHHFFISFDTRHPAVRLSPRLRGQYPEEMTIVLQHQFWDLTVADEGFEVGLSFGGVPERLHVPFEAVKGFFDPSVQFGLQFQLESDGAADAPATSMPAEGRLPVAAPQDLAAIPSPSPPQTKADATAEEPAKPSGGGEVVRLDRFRKK